MKDDWNANYEAGDLPWDEPVPEPFLVEAVEAGALPRGRALEIGCGTGMNARYLARAGWEVTAVDLAPKAVEIARERGGGER
ncbi:MAG: class I SAM-dependent methyltransferase, partial [Myxococcales bacterium]|nr:class I SAM-dependent methyltransferase [Myxococcales bacterium]